MPIFLKRSDFEKIRDYAVAQLPNEACGLLAGAVREDGAIAIEKAYLLTNVDQTNEHFSIDPREQLKAVLDARKNGLTPLGNWHSHPETPSRPSEEDKRLANDPKAIYAILSLAEEGNPVLNAFRIEGSEGARVATKMDLILTED